eukprot:1182559-Prorocentrum_minimum.AAC.2
MFVSPLTRAASRLCHHSDLYEPLQQRRRSLLGRIGMGSLGGRAKEAAGNQATADAKGKRACSTPQPVASSSSRVNY